jgi:hypothetical protein
MKFNIKLPTYLLIFNYYLYFKAPLQFQGGLTSGKRPVVKIFAKSLSQHDVKHVVPTSLCGIRVGRRFIF